MRDCNDILLYEDSEVKVLFSFAAKKVVTCCLDDSERLYDYVCKERKVGNPLSRGVSCLSKSFLDLTGIDVLKQPTKQNKIFLSNGWFPIGVLKVESQTRGLFCQQDLYLMHNIMTGEFSLMSWSVVVEACGAVSGNFIFQEVDLELVCGITTSAKISTSQKENQKLLLSLARMSIKGKKIEIPGDLVSGKGGFVAKELTRLLTTRGIHDVKIIARARPYSRDWEYFDFIFEGCKTVGPLVFSFNWDVEQAYDTDIRLTFTGTPITSVNAKIDSGFSRLILKTSEDMSKAPISLRLEGVGVLLLDFCTSFSARFSGVAPAHIKVRSSKSIKADIEFADGCEFIERTRGISVSGDTFWLNESVDSDAVMVITLKGNMGGHRLCIGDSDPMTIFSLVELENFYLQRMDCSRRVLDRSYRKLETDYGYLLDVDETLPRDEAVLDLVRFIEVGGGCDYLRYNAASADFFYIYIPKGKEYLVLNDGDFYLSFGGTEDSLVRLYFEGEIPESLEEFTGDYCEGNVSLCDFKALHEDCCKGKSNRLTKDVIEGKLFGGDYSIKDFEPRNFLF